jgi:thioredoxin reductase
METEPMKQYEAIIIGAGPTGIFAALTLADSGVKPILILEQGNDINQRNRTRRRNRSGWNSSRWKSYIPSRIWAAKEAVRRI